MDFSKNAGELVNPGQSSWKRKAWRTSSTRRAGTSTLYAEKVIVGVLGNRH